MATRYEEMCEIAKSSNNQWNDFKRNSADFIHTLLDGFIVYCQIPDGKIELLKWNGEHDHLCDYLPPEQDGHRFTAYGAITYDPAENGWRMGVRLWLTNLHFVDFAISAVRQDGRVVAKFDRKTYPVDPTSVEATQLHEAMASAIKQSYREPRDSDSRRVGFR